MGNAASHVQVLVGLSKIAQATLEPAVEHVPTQPLSTVVANFLPSTPQLPKGVSPMLNARPSVRWDVEYTLMIQPGP